jgi:hypothetical protein
LRIRLVDGQVISAALYAPNAFDTGRQATLDVVQELNRFLAESSGRANMAPPDR